MSSKDSKTNGPHRLVLNLRAKNHSQRPLKHTWLSNYIVYTRRTVNEANKLLLDLGRTPVKSYTNDFEKRITTQMETFYSHKLLVSGTKAD